MVRGLRGPKGLTKRWFIFFNKTRTLFCYLIVCLWIFGFVHITPVYCLEDRVEERNPQGKIIGWSDDSVGYIKDVIEAARMLQANDNTRILTRISSVEQPLVTPFGCSMLSHGVQPLYSSREKQHVLLDKF